MLICPDCNRQLTARRAANTLGPPSESAGVAVETIAEIVEYFCTNGHSYPVIRGIPRFVPSSNYADGFGFQWRKHATTQHDQFSGVPVSEERFFQETKWPRNLTGESILEVGCGSGRFTSHALSTGAKVTSLDLSNAIDVNSEINGSHPNLQLVQADISRMPFPRRSFDRVFCLGVLQHTPNPELAFKQIASHVRPGGSLVVDVYDRREGGLRFIEPFFRTYLWLRPITRRMNDATLYRWVATYVRTMWPVGRQIGRIPFVGAKLNKMLLIHDYRNRFALGEDRLLEWAILDAFDNLSPRYDQRQTLSTVKRWFRDLDYRHVEVHYGYNGIEARGLAPVS